MDKNRKGDTDFVPPDGGYGWVIVFSTTLINICVLPLVQCFGIIFKDEFIEMGITAAETSFLLHLHSAIYCSLGLFGSPLLKKYNFRSVALVGTILMCIGIFTTCFSKSYGTLVFTVSILIGIGQGILLPATYLATNTYFKKRLTLAVSFSVTGISISNIFMPQFCKIVLLKFGRPWTVGILSAISLIAIGFCLLLKPVVKQQQPCQNGDVAQEHDLEKLNPNEDNNVIQNHKNNEVYQETTISAKPNPDSFVSRIHNLFNLELLKEGPYIVAIIGMSVSFASELNIILMMPFVLAELPQFELGEIATALSVQSVADIFGRLCVPLGMHQFKISPMIMYSASLILATIGRTGIAIFYNSKSLIFCCAAILGLARGTKAVYQSVIIPRLVTLDKLPPANGLNMLLTGALSLIIGPIIGVVHDETNSYVYALHLASILSMFCVILWTINYWCTVKWGSCAQFFTDFRGSFL